MIKGWFEPMENITEITEIMNEWRLEDFSNAVLRKELLRHIKLSFDEAQNSLKRLYKFQLSHLEYLLSSMDFIQPTEVQN